MQPPVAVAGRHS